MHSSNLFQANYLGKGFFLVTILIFIWTKYPVLNTPFFWDELGVYGRMAFHLADTGPSMLPGSVDQWLSRGHPLLYPFIIALACDWFGTSVFTAHLANLVIAVFMLISVFIHVSQLYGSALGAIAATLLAVQPIFFAQAAMVLPEIALGLALWWCIWSYYKQRFLLYCIAGSVAVMIKEPAIVWILSITAFAFLFSRPRYSIQALRWLAPLLPFVVFLLIQKSTWGYYLFPYHSNSLNFHPVEVMQKFALNLKFLFWDQGRWSVLVATAAVVIGEWPSIRLKTFPASEHKAFILVSAFACTAYLLFSSLSFQAWRYLLPLMPFVALLTSRCIARFWVAHNLALGIVMLLICLVPSLYYMRSDHFECDNDMSYLRAIEGEKSALQYMIDNGIYKRDKFSVNMPLNYAVMDYRYGYLPDSVEIFHSSIISEKTDYAVALTPGTSLENPENHPIVLIHEQYYHDMKMSVYQVQHEVVK